MKVIIKTVEIPVYVSDDGKEFRHRENCLYYENKEKSKRKHIWRNRVFKDLENFIDSFDSGECVPLCDDTIIVNNLLLYQNAEERRTTIINIKTGHIGKAICNSNDNFDRKTGWAIAWTRYRGEEVPSYI